GWDDLGSGSGRVAGVCANIQYPRRTSLSMASAWNRWPGSRGEVWPLESYSYIGSTDQPVHDEDWRPAAADPLFIQCSPGIQRDAIRSCSSGKQCSGSRYRMGRENCSRGIDLRAAENVDRICYDSRRSIHV